MVVSIRLATIDDAATLHDAVIAIAETMNERHRITSSVEDFRRHGFGERPAFEALLAEIGSQVVGVCIFFPSFSTFRGRLGVYVQDLHVDPDHRKHGVGARLLQRLAELTRKRGGAYMRLSVDVENRSAQRFYEGLGLKHAPGEHIHAIYGDDFNALADKTFGGLDQP